MSTREEIEELGFEVPDSIEPIVAYRSWKLGNLALYSHNHTLWIPGQPLEANCGVFNNRRFTYAHSVPPEEKCGCGIYAAKKEEADLIVPKAHHFVYGEVYLWGKIVEGPRGFRAQYAYPKQFFVCSEEMKTMVEKLGFDVPVQVVEGSGRIDFPFLERNTPPRHRDSLTAGLTRLLRVPGLPALPCLIGATVDGLTLPMGQTFNQVMVGLLAAFGLAVAAMSFLVQHSIKRDMEIHMEILNRLSQPHLPPGMQQIASGSVSISTPTMLDLKKLMKGIGEKK